MQPSYRGIDLIEAINLILDFNETLLMTLKNSYNNKIKKLKTIIFFFFVYIKCI